MRLKVKVLCGLALLVALGVTFGMHGLPAMASTYATRCEGLTELNTDGCHGYFSNTQFYDSPSTPVWGIQGQDILYDPSNHSDWAIPASTDTASSFISLITGYLGTDNSYNYEKAGAAFIVDAMLGVDRGSQFTNATDAISYAQANIANWEARVNYYNEKGWITWDLDVTLNSGAYTGIANSLHACPNGTSTDDCTLDGMIGGSNDARDFAWFNMLPEDGTEDSHLIEFNGPGNNHFWIRRECGNLVGQITAGGLASPPTVDYDASSTVDNTTVEPGQGTTFHHYITTVNYYEDESVGWSIQRTVNGANDGGASTGTLHVTGSGEVNIANDALTAAQVAALAPGAQVCEKLTISIPGAPPPDAADPGSSQSCTTVMSDPYMTVSGNDVWAGSNFDTSDNSCYNAPAQDSTIKSWVVNGAGAVAQYGLSALGAISGFGSANNPGTDGLTFANTPSDGTLGASTRCIPDYYGTVGTGGQAWPGSGINGLPTNGGAQKYYHNGNLTIGAGTVPLGTQAVLVVNGTVTITGDINYASPYTSLASIPSLWIISNGDINIQENVQNLHGFFVAEAASGSANGVIQTCVETGDSTTYNPLHIGVCGNQLTVTGALLARQIYWQRTDGSAVSGQPAAEQVNFDPALYLSSPVPSTTTTSGGLSTQQEIELPPIY
jgi:hypothetical protein